MEQCSPLRERLAQCVRATTDTLTRLLQQPAAKDESRLPLKDSMQSRGGAGLLSDIPLGRVATPEEIASIITYCALEAPASMTGAVIDANGASFVR